LFFQELTKDHPHSILRLSLAIRGLIFDFDGLILDTETPEYQILQEMYARYGCTLPLEKWAAALGASFEAFQPLDYLEELAGLPLDKPALLKEWKERSLALILQQPALPGVREILDAARASGLRLGVASSSPSDWVFTHLKRLGLGECFELILTGSDVEHIKPHPQLYEECTRRLGLAPAEALAFEDSPNGITAARRAGLFCVAVPNPVSRHLDLSHASLILDSLFGLALDDLLLKANHQ
jgi:HAD superfamily hydrolase (TIGR01509 family)